MINKKFGIYDPVEDMFYMYFGKYSLTDDDEDNHGGTGDAICYLTHIILDKYEMYSHYPHKLLVKVIKTEIEKTFSDIYEKYGPFVSKCCSNNRHVILIASVDKLKRELTIENWGTNYKMPFDDFYSQCEKTYGADNLIYIVFVEEKIPEKVKTLQNTIAKQEFFSLFMDSH